MTTNFLIPGFLLIVDTQFSHVLCNRYNSVAATHLQLGCQSHILARKYCWWVRAGTVSAENSTGTDWRDSLLSILTRRQLRELQALQVTILKTFIVKIISVYKDNSFEYINNGNISSIHLFDNGLHLLEPGMCILANNFICKLNYFFTDTFTPSECTFLTKVQLHMKTHCLTKA